MAKVVFQIKSVFEGQMPSALFGQPGEFLTSIGIDPDMPATDSASDLKTSGIIRPVNYEKFSSTEIDAAPIKIITTPKDSFMYVVLSNGKLISYVPGDLGSELVTNGTFTGSATGWTLGTNWSYSSNQVTHSSGNTATLSQSFTTVVGTVYLVTLKITGAASTVSVTVGGSTAKAYNAGAGVMRYMATATATSGGIVITPGSTFDGSIDDVSVKVYTASGNFSAPVLVGTTSAGNARGAAYYNNYINIAVSTDVSRYGPLDGTPLLTNNFWTSTLGKTALTDSQYPVTLFSIGYLNHFMFTHVDDKLYFLDYKNGVGMVHFIKTTKGTYEGDTDDGSTYNALDLPLNFIPVTGSSYGNDVGISGAFTTSSTVNQGKSALFLWNTVDDSFYRNIPLLDVLCSILRYVNGVLYGISGDIAGGYRLFRYVGGDAVETLKIIEDGRPPLQNAVDAVGNRVVWGANTTYPMVSSGLYAYGSKSDLFPRGLHHIALSGFT